MKTEQHKRKFRGIWIPSHIWCNEKLNIIQKTMMAEIDSLSGHGKCFASNQYFAEFFGISKRRVSSIISELNEMGLISVEMTFKGNTKQVDKRFLSVTQSVVFININKPTEKPKERTTRAAADIDSVVSKWNDITGQKLKKETPGTRKLIFDLLSRGFSTNDLLGVVRVKNKEWCGRDETRKWVRPSTLFGAKFDEYLQQSIQQSPKNKVIDRDKLFGHA